MSTKKEIVNGAERDKTSLSSPFVKVPELVRVYGFIIMGVNAIYIVIGLVVSIMLLKEPGGEIIVPLTAPIYFFVVFVMFRLGKGLKNGERKAVYGLCILSGFAVIMGIIWLNPLEMLISIPSWMLIYAPPIISAFKNWEAFH